MAEQFAQPAPSGWSNKQSRAAKIAIIGGGSLSCAHLMKCLIEQPALLRGSHITLMDIDEESLDLIYTISEKKIRQAGVELTLERTLQREEAIADADFVLTTFRPGGLQARLLDEQIPLQYGLIGHDTIGAGGFFYALRTAPVLAGIAAEMEKVAPRAFLLNYANPSSIVLEAIAHSSGIRVIGLHERPFRDFQKLVALAGFQPAEGKRLYPRTIGLSHGNWTTALWYDGEDILPAIVAWCEQYISTAPVMTAENYSLLMQITLTAHYKSIPSHYMHYYYFPEKVLEFQRTRPTFPTQDLLNSIPAIRAHYRNESHKDNPQIQTLPGDDGMGQFILAIMHAILNDTGEEWVLNVENNGALNFLDDDRIVKLPCRVDVRGATPLTQGNGGLEIDQRGLLALLAEYEGATARVALWGDRRAAIKALATNPLVMSYSRAEQVYDALASAHAHHLPARLLK